MPTLTWVGKDKVVNHHHDVPFKVLRHESHFDAPEGSPLNSTGNRIIHGDNLEALKSLLPEFEGKVNCIYIDPPYNTGNEGWAYNDAVNDPKIKKWLGQVVGKEGEDLSRHDKWLCMMYPRLKLLHRLLAKDGVILISIDQNEFANIKHLLEEIFGASNWVGEIIWRNVTDNNPTNICLEHEYILCYAKNKGALTPVWKSAHLDVKQKLIEIGNKLNNQCNEQSKLQETYTSWFREHKSELWPLDRYKFIDAGGIYTGSQSVHNPGKEGYRYDVIHPETNKPCKQPLMGYRFPEETMKRLLLEERIIFGENETKLIELKLYAKDYKNKLPSVIELDGRTGTNEIKSIFPENKRPFNYPKPSVLIEDLLGFTTKPNDLILDSFAGSGTTAHAILKLNVQDKGNRKFIIIEMEDYADTITAERVRRVISGYGEGTKKVAGLGGSFDYYTIGEAIFNPDDTLNEAVGIEVIRHYVAYSEGIPNADQTPQDNTYTPYLMGLNSDTAWLFYYEPNEVTCLDLDFLNTLKFGAAKPGTAIIYADKCLLTKEFMTQYGIIFKKIPRDITRF